MKFSRTTLAIAFTGASCLSSAAAFSPNTIGRTNTFGTRTIAAHNRGSSLVPLQMSAADEVAALRAKAAQLRGEAEDAAKAMGKDFTTAKKEATGVPIIEPATPEEILNSLSSKQVNFEVDDATSQNDKLDELAKSNDLVLWKAAQNGNANTGSPAPLRTFPVSQELMSSRSNGIITGETLGVGGDSDVTLEDFQDATIAVVVGSSVAALGSLIFLPDNIGAGLCYLFALIPILFIGVGSTAPGIIAGGIALTRGTADDNTARDRRICAHEAGHFLCGYLCGLPIKNYEITKDGVPCVEFHASVENANEQREYTNEEIAALSVVALSGSVAEVINFGQARGGESDLIELDRLFRRSKEFVGAQKQQDLTRWGALTSYNLIKGNQARYEKLVDAFAAKKSVSECIAIIEARD